MAQAQREWLLAVDGAARGNPGPAGCGAVLYDDSGAVRKTLSRYLGSATNNAAEYQALLMGLEAALSLGVGRIRVQSDSELLVRQMNGEYRVRHPNLLPLFEKAQRLLRQFARFHIFHVGREANRFADRLANQGIDDAINARAKAD